MMHGGRRLIAAGLVALGLLALLVWTSAPAVHLEGLIALHDGAVLITRAVDQPRSMLRRIGAGGETLWELPLGGVLHDGSGQSSAVQGMALVSLVETPTGVDGVSIDLTTGQIQRRQPLPAGSGLFVAPRWDASNAVRFVTQTAEGAGLGRWDPTDAALDWLTSIPDARPTLAIARGATTLLYNGRWWAVGAKGARFAFDRRFLRGTCFSNDAAVSVVSAGLLRQTIGGQAVLVNAEAHMLAQTCGHRGQDIVVLGSDAGAAMGIRINPVTGQIAWSRRWPELLLVQTAAGVDWRDERWHPLRGAMLPIVPVPFSYPTDQTQWVMLDTQTGEPAWASAPLPDADYASYFSFRSPGELHHLVGDQGRHIIAFDGRDGALTGAVRGDIDRIRASNVVGGVVWAAQSSAGSANTPAWVQLNARSLRVIARGHPEKPHLRDDLRPTAVQLGIQAAR
ncbi:MAG: hypothetical protein ACI9U2_001058 [Bradymonadia bacterium]|jgi:hypothetical protein